MRTLPHPLSVVLLALLISTLPGCVSLNRLDQTARFGSTESVRTVLDQGGREGEIDGALVSAACSDRTETVQLLLERGANVNYVDTRFVATSYSPLQCAAVNGNEQMVSLLLQYGADREYKGANGLTALELAKKERRTSVVKFLEAAPAAPAATPPKPLAPAPSSAESPPPPIY